MDTASIGSASRRDTRIVLILALVALATGLAKAVPALAQKGIQSGIRIAFQLAILAIVMTWVSRYWPF